LGSERNFSSEMHEMAEPESTKKIVSTPSKVPDRCGRVSKTSGGVREKREQT